MAAPLFTVKVSDGLGAHIGADEDMFAGATCVLTSSIKDGDVVPVDGKLRTVPPVTVILDETGKINGDTGIQLLADDPSLGLDNPLQWTITIKRARAQGFTRPVKQWTIVAGADGETVDLATEPPVVGSTAIGVRGFRTRAVPVVGDPTMAQWVDENGLEVGDPVPWSQVISEEIAVAAVEAEAPAAVGQAAAELNITVEPGPTPGKVQVVTNGVPAVDEFNPLPASWTEVAGKPTTVLEANNRSRAVIRRSRPGVVRRVAAPGGLSWLDSHIRVFYDRHKFFTDFDVTAKRHTGTRWYSDRVNGLSSNSGRSSTLAAALSGGVAVTSLSVAALPAAFPFGSKVIVAAQDPFGAWHSMVATLSAQADAAATTISVNSVTPDYSYPVGALVANPMNTVYKAYTLAAAGDQVIALDRASNAFGGVLDRSGGWGFGETGLSNVATLSAALSTGAPITSLPTTALSALVGNGNTVTLESGSNFQTFVVTASASAGATSITVASQTPNYAFPSGTLVRTGNRITKSITIAAQFPGEVKLVIGDWHGSGGASTWALKGGYSNVYTVTRSSARKVVDSGVGEVGMEYTLVADATACDALPGSYYITGSEVGVHYIKGGSPDPKRVHVLITAEQLTVRNENGDMSVYFEGFDIYGGSKGNLWCENTAMGNLDAYLYRMGLFWALDNDSLSADGVRYAFSQECRAAHSMKDGFNYASRDRGAVLRNSPKFIEVDCESWAQGLGNPISGSENTNNASTAHEGAQGVRIGGHYHETTGAVLADVQTGTETWNVECDAWGSLSESDTYDRAIDAQQSGTTMHVWNCRGFDSLYDLEARAGTVLNVFNTEYDTTGVGSGTINTITSV